MGQQQLLLLVLGIVIVGLAIVAGINAVEQNQRKSSQDALVQEAFRFATDTRAWYLKPTQFGGGGSSAFDAGVVDWGKLGVTTNSGSAYDTPWGTITLDNDAASVVSFDLRLNNEDADYGDVTFTAPDVIQFAEASDTP